MTRDEEGALADAERSPEVVRLGCALWERVGDCGAQHDGRFTTVVNAAPDVPTDVRAVVLDTQELASRVIARFLTTGEAATPEEAERLATMGRLTAVLPVAEMVRANLTWRDRTLQVLREEAARFEGGQGALEVATEVVSRSFDVNLVRIVTASDRERGRLEQALGVERDKLVQLALHDPLTGLSNRSLFMERLGHAVTSAARYRSAVGVLFLDLDGFKPVNDALGHAAGDELLLQVSGRLAAQIRASDTLSRFGGDEFVILCDRLPGDGGQAQQHLDVVARRVLTALRDPYLLAVGEARISVSVGGALSLGDEEPESLLRHADAAMYAAKRCGAGTYLCADAPRRAE